MSLSRRRFLHGVGASTLAPLMIGASGCGSDRDETILAGNAPGAVEPWPSSTTENTPFRHGVASGDPHADSVVLWTRVTPEAPDQLSIEVEWRVALDPELTQVVSGGSARAEASSDFTLHVIPRALAQGTTYYYQFRALGRSSPVGRTRTLPASSASRLRIGVATCANYPAGFFNAYALMAAADLDVVLHLGDYIYEYPNGTLGDGTSIGRSPDPPHEIVSLEDYRARHAQYKTDPDLQELHRQHPMIAVWDDHEIANDAFQGGAQNHQSTEGDFAERKASAERAYREWLPLRSGDGAKLYRAFSCGELCDIILLDARVEGRERQVGACDVAQLSDPARHLLGSEQESWLVSELRASQARGARFRLLGQQVIFAPLLRSPGGCVDDPDKWDGYLAARARLLQALDDAGVDNVVVLTGDAHSSWAMDVPSDPFDAAVYDAASGRGSRLVEFVAPPISSPGAGADAARIMATHPHVKFTDQSRQGYMLLDVTRERVQAEWYFVSTVRERRAEARAGAAFVVRAGEARVIPGGEMSATRAEAPGPAPG